MSAHEDALVILLDDHGNIAGAKPRNEVDKVHDILHCADVLVFNSERRLMLSRIPAGELYGGLHSSSMATILRQGESPRDAAVRGLKKELNIENAELNDLGEEFFTYPDGVKRKKTLYWCNATGPIVPNPSDVAEISSWTRTDLTRAIDTKSDLFAPTFLGIWNFAGNKLPL